MRATIIKSLVFTVVTVLATAALATTIRNPNQGSTSEYTGIFEDVTSLNVADDVRMAGVKVGSVTDIQITDKRYAKVGFTVQDDVTLPKGTIAQLKFRNLVGQRYISLDPPGKTTSNSIQASEGESTFDDAADQASGTGTSAATATGGEIRKGYTFPLSQTRPALDLTMLFNGFQPLLQFLDPEEVDALSAQVIAVFQGEGSTVEGLLASTSSLTRTLAEKDEVIDQLIVNLTSVLDTVNDRSGQLDSTIITLQRLVSGLAQDRETIGDTLDGLGRLTTSVAGLLEEGREPLKGSIDALDRLSTELADSEQVLNEFFETLPIKLDALGRIGSYGSWINFYECKIAGDIPSPEGYMGDRGALPVAERCQA